MIVVDKNNLAAVVSAMRNCLGTARDLNGRRIVARDTENEFEIERTACLALAQLIGPPCTGVMRSDTILLIGGSPNVGAFP
jgi:hypothetical protein